MTQGEKRLTGNLAPAYLRCSTQHVSACVQESLKDTFYQSSSSINIAECNSPKCFRYFRTLARTSYCTFHEPHIVHLILTLFGAKPLHCCMCLYWQCFLRPLLLIMCKLLYNKCTLCTIFAAMYITSVATTLEAIQYISSTAYPMPRHTTLNSAHLMSTLSVKGRDDIIYPVPT